MSLDTYEIGDTLEIPITFTDPNTGQEATVPDANIEIYKGNTPIVTSTPLILISGGRFTFSYTIPPAAPSGIYTAYVTGTVAGSLQTATISFSVSNRQTQLQDTSNSIKIDIQSAKIDLDNQIDDIKEDIGDPSADGTTIHSELQAVLADLGNPLVTGQDITQKLDDIRTILGVGTPVGIVTASGVVLNDHGLPISGVRVVATNTATGNSADTDISSATGTYVLHLNPGSYVLQFIQATTVLKQTASLVVPTGVTTLAVPNVSLAMKRTVTDKVQDPDKVPIPGVLVKAILSSNYDANAADNKVEAAAFTDTNGDFMIELFPGIYIFEFIKSDYHTMPQEVTVV